MTTSTKLGVPYIAQSQNQPEVTHNTALYMLEALMRGVKALQNAPPVGPADGDTYIVGTAGSGVWLGHNNQVAIWNGASWTFIPGVDTDGTIIAMGAAQEGMRVYNQATDLLMTWTGAVWIAVSADPVFTFATLPAAATYPRARAWVSDSNLTWASANIGANVAAGGANLVPVKSDGANWRIG